MAKKFTTKNEEKNETVLDLAKEMFIEIPEVKEESKKEEKEVIKLMKELESQEFFKVYLNDFFKYYLAFGLKELNALLLVENCIEFITGDFEELLKLYLLSFKHLKKIKNATDNSFKIRKLTNTFRETYPLSSHVFKNITLIFETNDKKYFVGDNYKLYSIKKEMK